MCQEISAAIFRWTLLEKEMISVAPRGTEQYFMGEIKYLMDNEAEFVLMSIDVEK